MIIVKNRFDSSIVKIKSSHSLYVHLVEEKGFAHEVVADILRSEIVYLVSALDRFFHDLVLEGMLEIFNGVRPNTSSYGNFSISLSQQNALKNAVIPDVTLRGIIIERHKYLAFQDPEKISGALSMVWNESHKWQKIALEIGMDMNVAKIKLKNLIIRRNQIVHESDLDLFTGTEVPIIKSDVEELVDFVDNLCVKVYDLVKI